MKTLLSALLAVLLCCPTLLALDDPRPVVDDSKAVVEKPADPKLPTLFIVGDSSVKSNSPLRGWGSEISPYFDTSKINVVNRAIGGEGEETAEITKPDGGKEIVHTFGWYMRKYCTDAKARGATVILCSMVPGPAKVDPLFGDARTHSTPAGAKFNAACEGNAE